MLWGLSLIVLAHLLLSGAMEMVLPQLRDPEYGYRLVRLREQQWRHPDRPLVLILGTSRTQNAISPKAMAFPDEPGSPLVFNFGQAGSHPLHQRLSLQRLFADGVCPAAVLVEICPATLSPRGPADRLFTPTANRLTAADLPRLDPYLADRAALRRHWIVSRLNPWHAQRLVLLCHLAPRWLPWQQRIDFQWSGTDRFGFMPHPANKIEEFRQAPANGRSRSMAGLSNIFR